MHDPNHSPRRDVGPRGVADQTELRPLLGVQEVSDILGVPRATLYGLALHDHTRPQRRPEGFPRRASSPILVGGPGRLHQRVARQRVLTTGGGHK